jgi:hypothetical protein
MVLMTGATMLEWWLLQIEVISGVGHPRSDSVGLLMMNGSVQYIGHWCCITGPLGQRKPYQEGVKILGIPYRIEL